LLTTARGAKAKPKKGGTGAADSETSTDIINIFKDRKDNVNLLFLRDNSV
jgi:hypothetical protein